MTVQETTKLLNSFANPKNLEGMARFGINTTNTLGLSMVIIRQIAKDIKKDHQLALDLWETGIHEAKILAGLIDDWKFVTEEQMEHWVAGFDSWDVCDQVVMNLFDKTPFAHGKAFEWAEREQEFVRRAGFALMASMAVHLKKAKDEYFEPIFEVIIKHSTDERNFVRKAVNWALRQIGKRNRELNKRAIETAEIISTNINSKSARWIAADALKELIDPKTIERINNKKVNRIN